MTLADSSLLNCTRSIVARVMDSIVSHNHDMSKWYNRHHLSHSPSPIKTAPSCPLRTRQLLHHICIVPRQSAHNIGVVKYNDKLTTNKIHLQREERMTLTAAKPDRWTDQQPFVVTDNWFHAWSINAGRSFVCGMCMHKFEVGDVARWVMMRRAPNTFVCASCDGEDIRQRFDKRWVEIILPILRQWGNDRL